MGGELKLNTREMLEINKEGWNKVADQFFEGSFEVFGYGLYMPDERELNLLGNIKDSVILEVGCGSGHSLEYFAKYGARELWGVDLSSEQIKTAKEVVSNFNIPIHFIEAPMEDIPGLPIDYFDKVVSIFALGWTVDLPKTLGNIYRSLKKNGELIFSWEHPLHTILSYENDSFILNDSYLNEGPIKINWRGVPIVMHRRKVSTFVNSLINAGFIIDQLVEESKVPEDDNSDPARWYSGKRAKFTPSTLVIKCHKA